LAVTATGPRQMSSGCYCETQSGQYNTCLADLFSATWMEDLDAVCRAFHALAIHLKETNLFKLNNTLDTLTRCIYVYSIYFTICLRGNHQILFNFNRFYRRCWNVLRWKEPYSITTILLEQSSTKVTLWYTAIWELVKKNFPFLSGTGCARIMSPRPLWECRK